MGKEGTWLDDVRELRSVDEGTGWEVGLSRLRAMDGGVGERKEGKKRRREGEREIESEERDRGYEGS